MNCTVACFFFLFLSFYVCVRNRDPLFPFPLSLSLFINIYAQISASAVLFFKCIERERERRFYSMCTPGCISITNIIYDLIGKKEEKQKNEEALYIRTRV